MDGFEDSGRIIFLLLVVVISAVQWAAKKLKERHQARAWQAEAEAEERELRRRGVRKPAPTPIPEPTPEPEPDPLSELRDLFETRTKTAPTPPALPTPTPAPTVAPVAEAPTKPTAEQIAAARRMEAATNFRSQPVRAGSLKTLGRAQIHSLLQTPEGARAAVILGEVIGKPKAFE